MMQNVARVFTQPTLVKLFKPEQRALLNDRLLKVAKVTVEGNQFPAGGSFLGMNFGGSRGVTGRIADGTITITEGKVEPLVLRPAKVVVFLQRVNAQVKMLTLPEEPIYNTIIYAEDAGHRIYLEVFGSRLAYYLVKHDVGFAVEDLLQLGKLDLSGDEHSFAAAIKQYGYGKLVAETPVAFLDNDKATMLEMK